jgi:monoglucosyldiacylglycerol epimerase
MNHLVELTSQLPLAAVSAIFSIVLAEIIRDLFHIAGHYWQPLQAGHLMHHKAYRSDLSMVSIEAYRQAQWHNDVPEATFMVVSTGAIACLGYYLGLSYGLIIGCLYSLLFLITSMARAKGLLMTTDLTHKPGDLLTIPTEWTVNRTYHWRHHFDRGEAYFCSTFTFVDKIWGTALALKGKTIAVTGANGALGRSLVRQLQDQGAKVIALTTSDSEFGENVEVIKWAVGQESELANRLQKVDILIINHGANAHGDRTPEAIHRSFEVNTFSAWRLMEIFFGTVQQSKHKAIKEVWINTSEAEVNPAFSPLYEMSKRTLGDLITLRRLGAPCVVRKLVLGAFKSNLNPIGIMSPDFVAWAILELAKRDFRDIIVTFNPFTYLFFPLKEFGRSLYFRLFSKDAPLSLSKSKTGVERESH